jgi:PBP1b-binding outer membrane lipoprotein LpoB
MKKAKITLILLLSLVLLAACSPKAEPKTALQDALKKQAAVTSYNFNGSAELNFQLPAEAAGQDPTSQMVINALKDTKLTWSGAYRLEPFQTEILFNLSTNINGANITLEIPVIANEETVFFKIPMLTQDQFVAADLKELSQMMDGDNPFSAEGLKKNQELVLKIEEIVFASLKDDLFTRNEITDQMTLPSGEINDLVSIVITQENIAPLLNQLYKESLPQIIDLFGQNGILSSEEVTEAKNSLAKNNIEQQIQELQQKVKINHFQWDSYIDKQGQIRKQEIALNLEDVTGEGKFGTIDLKITSSTDNINGTPTFKHPIPSKEETIPFTDFIMLMGGGL